MADKEFSGRGPGTLGGGNTEHNLTGFSTSDAWDKVQETGAWSHYPVTMGPKEGLRDPIIAGPPREELPQDDLMHTPFPRTNSDDSVKGRF